MRVQVGVLYCMQLCTTPYSKHVARGGLNIERLRTDRTRHSFFVSVRFGFVISVTRCQQVSDRVVRPTMNTAAVPSAEVLLYQDSQVLVSRLNV